MTSSFHLHTATDSFKEKSYKHDMMPVLLTFCFLDELEQTCPKFVQNVHIFIYLFYFILQNDLILNSSLIHATFTWLASIQILLWCEIFVECNRKFWMKSGSVKSFTSQSHHSWLRHSNTLTHTPEKSKNPHPCSLLPANWLASAAHGRGGRKLFFIFKDSYYKTNMTKD